MTYLKGLIGKIKTCQGKVKQDKSSGEFCKTEL